MPQALAGHARRALVLLLALASLAAPAWARPFRDAAGRVVEVPDRPVRVIAAGPPAAVLLYTLAPSRLAAWVSAPPEGAMSFLAPEVRDLPVSGRLTGRGGTANVEAVLALKPDLVVDAGSLGPTYASLADRVQAQTGIPYILLDGSLAATAPTYRLLGQLLGEEARGADLAEAAQAILDAVAAKVDPLPPERRPVVYYGRGPKGLETGLPGSINAEILERAGGRNAAPRAAGGLVTVDPEQVLAWNPAVIVTVEPAVQALFRTDPLWRGLAAVRGGRVYRAPTLPFGWFDAPPGVNRLIGLRWLAGLLHPDLFPEPLPDAVRAFYRRFYHRDLDAGQEAALLDGTGDSDGSKVGSGAP